MAEVKWIKIAADMYDDEKMLVIDSLPDGDMIAGVWMKLLCRAGKQNRNGRIMLGDDIPLTVEFLATVIRRPVDKVKYALETLERFHMIAFVDGVLEIVNWEKHQNTDRMNEMREYNRQAKQRSRSRVNDTSSECQDDVNEMSMTVKTDVNDVSKNVNDCQTDVKTDVNDCQTSVNDSQKNVNDSQCTDKIREEEIREEEIRVDVDTEEEDADEDTAGESPPTSCPYAKIMEMYHLLCPSLPKIKNISGDRKKFVAARWREFPSIDTFAELFRIAEASSFLKHGNAKWKGADFDWMMKPTNFPRVLEHKYDEDYSVPLPPRDLPKPKQPEPGKLTLGEDSSFDTDEFFTMALKRSYGGIDPRETGITYGDNAGGAQ